MELGCVKNDHRQQSCLGHRWLRDASRSRLNGKGDVMPDNIIAISERLQAHSDTFDDPSVEQRDAVP